MTLIKLLNTETNEVEYWTLETMLAYINEDRNPEWQPYTEADWRDGWNHFCDGSQFQLLS